MTARKAPPITFAKGQKVRRTGGDVAGTPGVSDPIRHGEVYTVASFNPANVDGEVALQEVRYHRDLPDGDGFRHFAASMFEAAS
jgi:hypothetical protein